MPISSLEKEGNQVILRTEGAICSTGSELMASPVVERLVQLFLEQLKKLDSPLLSSLVLDPEDPASRDRLLELLRLLAEKPLAQALQGRPDLEPLARERDTLYELVEALYTFWMSFDRFLICHSEHGPDSHDRKPFRTFNATAGALAGIVRGVYRDVCENISGEHPRIYRQVSAGCDMGVIAVPKDWKRPSPACEVLAPVPFVRQILINPPLLLDPPMNKRTGQFKRVAQNPLEGLRLDPAHWMCYPAQVGPLVIFVYFHPRFISLACSMANLFELATDAQVAKGPDAIYLYGVEPSLLAQHGDLPTVIYDDERTGMLVGAVPAEDRFGYFGYVKKMVLTLHNIVMMKRGRMPYHGAMVRISLRTGVSKTFLFIGDTATGKSESLEALRLAGKDRLREMRVVADDMGSMAISPEGKILGYGTEIGAFVRLDDLQTGYAFAQLDRAIIMSPHKINARVVLPVTTLAEVLRGYSVDVLLYANNYEEVDATHPVVERFKDAREALAVFSAGASMSKGTTTSKGLVHSYFANIFGPAQYRELHEPLAAKVFEAAFKAGVFVGHMRTRLGIPGYESKGPQAVAEALLGLMA